ncbi:MAG TPA: AsmA-like C-terminal region-containing protein, partial [Paracoccaceae bacterium]|nr:AsmA-like C-terminal region-containing protein [Paracoccaceae bacterium]
TAGGFTGRFAGRINGQAPVEGQVAPSTHGSMVRVTSADGGAVLSAAGIFPNARGGQLDMTLTPLEQGGYTGDATLSDVRIRNAPVLAELLSAVSIVGLLEQLNGSGILFTDADARFRLTSGGVDIRRAAAVGASMGVSLAGVYRAETRQLDMQGVISPLYLVNGIGAILTRRGEGLFGVNYRITGPTADPNVTVNPLSILTPGMFREIFRRPPPRIRAGG